MQFFLQNLLSLKFLSFQKDKTNTSGDTCNERAAPPF